MFVLRSAVMCCAVLPKVLLPKGKGRDVYPRVQVNGRSVCVARALCASVFTTAESGGMHWCPLLCPVAAGPVRGTCAGPGCGARGGGGPALAAERWWRFLRAVPSPPLRPTRCCALGRISSAGGFGRVSCSGKASCPKQGILLLSASLPRGSGQWPSCSILPHCLGVLGQEGQREGGLDVVGWF